MAVSEPQDYDSHTERLGVVTPDGRRPGSRATAAPQPGTVARERRLRRWQWAALGALTVGIGIAAMGGAGTSTPAPATRQAPALSAPGPAAPAPVAPAAPAGPAASTSQGNALRKAQDYLAYTAFSKSRLAHQLEFEGFTAADAQYAVEHVGADWMAQADKKAADYMSYSAFSKSALIRQLKFEGFTAAEAAHGAAAVGL